MVKESVKYSFEIGFLRQRSIVGGKRRVEERERKDDQRYHGENYPPSSGMILGPSTYFWIHIERERKTEDISDQRVTL